MERIQICSVAPVAFLLERLSYNFSASLPACLPPAEFTSVWIKDATDNKVLFNGGWTGRNDKEYVPITIPAQQIVDDVFNSEQLREKGCFAPAGAVPTQEELQAAHDTRTRHLQREVENADKVYGQLGPAGLSQISDYAKRCARELGLTPAWVVTMQPRMQECPACGESVKMGVAVCKSCGAILDREKAIQFGLIGPGPGRPKKEKTEEVAA